MNGVNLSLSAVDGYCAVAPTRLAPLLQGRWRIDGVWGLCSSGASRVRGRCALASCYTYCAAA